MAEIEPLKPEDFDTADKAESISAEAASAFTAGEEITAQTDVEKGQQLLEQLEESNKLMAKIAAFFEGGGGWKTQDLGPNPRPEAAEGMEKTLKVLQDSLEEVKNKVENKGKSWSDFVKEKLGGILDPKFLAILGLGIYGIVSLRQLASELTGCYQYDPTNSQIPETKNTCPDRTSCDCLNGNTNICHAGCCTKSCQMTWKEYNMFSALMFYAQQAAQAIGKITGDLAKGLLDSLGPYLWIIGAIAGGLFLLYIIYKVTEDYAERKERDQMFQASLLGVRGAAFNFPKSNNK